MVQAREKVRRHHAQIGLVFVACLGNAGDTDWIPQVVENLIYAPIKLGLFRWKSLAHVDKESFGLVDVCGVA